jgi:hypothetical protein
MRQKSSASCAQFLQTAGLPMLERVHKLQRLERAVLQLLPADLAAHCKVMNLRKEILVLYTTSAAWAARLRFAAPDLIKQLRCQLSLDVTAIKVRVQPPDTPDALAKRRHVLNLSMKNANLLAHAAGDVDHPALQEALYRLAAKARDF